MQNHIPHTNTSPGTADLPGPAGSPGMTARLIGCRVIVRCYASGVHYGTLSAHDGRQVTLTQSRRLWRWHTGGKDKGVSLSAVALTGIDAKQSVVEPVLPEIVLLDALEIIPAADVAAVSIDGA